MRGRERDIRVHVDVCSINFISFPFKTSSSALESNKYRPKLNSSFLSGETLSMYMHSNRT